MDKAEKSMSSKNGEKIINNKCVSGKTIAVRIIVTVIAAFLCAFLVETIYTVNWNILIGVKSSHLSRNSYTVTELEYGNMTVDDNGLVTCGEDAYFIVDLDETVNFVEIKAHGMEYTETPVRIYPVSQGEEASEENIIQGEILSNEKTAFIGIGNQSGPLKINIGESGDTFTVDGIILNPSAADYVLGTLSNVSLIRMFVYFIIFLLIGLAIIDFKKFRNTAYKYRWAIGLLFIAFCTIFRLHGSSIGQLAQTFSGHDVSLLWGVSRAVRSDEYAVFTEMALSQVKTGFEWFSDVWGYSASDMFLTYGQPVTALVTLFRPFSAGYLIFGAQCGLAFYWSSRLAICFLVSFEFGRMITKDDKVLSLAYALLISLSPVVQWWYSINELVEMLIFGQLAIMLFLHFFKTDKIWKKIIIMAGVVICAGGYIMTLYPAWMVPFFYAFIACLIAVIVENRKSIHIKLKDVLIAAGGIIVLAAALIFIYSMSKDTLKLTLNTVYPGQRSYTGGPLSNITEIFRGWTSWIWALTNNLTSCEKVDFISFFPLGLILSVIVVFVQKKRDIWLIVLNICSILLIIFFVVPMPGFIAAATMLKYTSAGRIMIAIGFLNLIVFIRAICLIRWKRIYIAIMALGAILGTLISLKGAQEVLTGAIKWIVLIVMTAMVIVICITLLKGRKAVLLICAALLGLVGGVCVNPISSGLDCILDNRLVSKIEEISETDSGSWISCGGNTLANIPAICGAKCVSCIATYPDYEMWSTIGLEDKADIWNRYANFYFTVEDQTDVSIITPDFLKVDISIEDLKKLGVKYILSFDDLSRYEALDAVYKYNNFTIWEIAQ